MDVFLHIKSVYRHPFPCKMEKRVKTRKKVQKTCEKVLTNADSGGILAKLSARDIANDSAKDLEN